jgi:hypothetical protein
MNPPNQRLKLHERNAARRLVLEHGAKQAARLLGLQDTRTVRKAALGEPVHPLTVATVRAGLAALSSRRPL